MACGNAYWDGHLGCVWQFLTNLKSCFMNFEPVFFIIAQIGNNQKPLGSECINKPWNILKMEYHLAVLCLEREVPPHVLKGGTSSLHY
jgi:hypothetical protein